MQINTRIYNSLSLTEAEVLDLIRKYVWEEKGIHIPDHVKSYWFEGGSPWGKERVVVSWEDEIDRDDG